MVRCEGCHRQRQPLRDGLCNECRGDVRNPEQKRYAEEQERKEPTDA